MQATFLESQVFGKDREELLPDPEYAILQKILLENPEIGQVMPGCGGLRKLRIGNPRRGKGKRGGARLVYLHVPDACVIFMVAIYDKNMKEDLSADEKEVLSTLAQIFKQQSLVTYQRWLEENQP